MPELVVKVLDYDTGKGLFGVLVALDSYVTGTDHTGIARIVVPAGRYTLRIRSPFYEPVTDDINITRDMTITVKLRKLHL